MKKRLLIGSFNAGMAIMFAVILQCCLASPAQAEFLSRGRVYTSSGVSGDATTPNSFATAHIFRRQVSGQKKESLSQLVDPVVYDYLYATTTNPARILVNVDAGLNAWTNISDADKRDAICVVETVRGANGYSGGLDYICSASYTILDADISANGFRFPNINIQPIPTPESDSPQNLEGTVKLKWTGITTSDASGNLINSAETYAVYRSTSLGGTYTLLTKEAVHVSGEVRYQDTYNIASGQQYFYKLKMKYSWPASSSAYYISSAESLPSSGITAPQEAPTITAINPNTALNTGEAGFVITGTNLLGIEDVKLRKDGVLISCESFSIGSSTSINATFEFFPWEHSIGTWEVRVYRDTIWYTSTPLLRLTAEAPSITSIEPQSAGTNSTITGFKVYGSRLYPGSAVRITKGSATFTASSVTTNSGYSMLTCNTTLTNATIGTWDVVVASMFNQATRESLLLVTAEAPTATSITPPTGTRGTSVSITSLAGTNLFDDTVVKLQRTGYPTVDATGVAANASHTSESFTLPIYATAETGLWDIFILNSDGKSVLKSGFFTVTAAPTVAAISPATAENSGPVTVTITGSNFFAPVAASLEMTGQGTIAATIISSADSTISCSFDITDATIGTWDVVVVNRDGSGRKTRGFTVTSEAPTFSSISPNSGYGGFPVSVTISGDKFYDNAVVELRRTGRTTASATSVSVPDINTINCSFMLSNESTDVGLWDVYIRNTDGKSTMESGKFTVNYGEVATPSACAIIPLSTSAVRVTWQDNSGNEELFRISKLAGSTWTDVGTVERNTTQYTGAGTTGLGVNTVCSFRVRAEGGGQITAYNTADATYTLAEAPSPEGFTSITSTTITANWSANGNPAGTDYYCQNQDNGNNSGTIESLSWANSGLLPDLSYSYRVRAFNGNGVPTSWASLGSQRTQEKRSVYYFAVDEIKLLSGDILGATANISVVFSSEAGIDISSFRMIIDGREVTDGTNIYYDSYSVDGIFTTVNYKIRTALTEGTYTISASATDPSGILFQDERTDLRVMSETTKMVVGYVLPYPNPYDPTKGSVKLTYRLATDTNTTIYVFDVNGRLVWKQAYISQFNGGKAGYNEILWNGYDAFSRILDNDVYLIRIVETGTGKVMGKGKIVVVKTVSRKNDDDKGKRLAAAPVNSGSGPDPFAGGKAPVSDIAKLLLLSVVGLVAFEELARMFFSIKKISGIKL